MTKSLNVTQLKAKVKAAQKASAVKITEAAIKAGLEATLVLENSTALFAAKVNLATITRNTEALQKLVNECSAIVDNTPVVNSKTNVNRVWAGSRRFAYGAQINLMYQLATGIMYSCAEHKLPMLAHTGLSDELIEQFVEAFGTPSYYSRNNNVVVEAKPYEIYKLQGTLTVLQSELGVIVDTSQITTSALSMEFSKSDIKAQIDNLKAEEAIANVGTLAI